MNWTEDLKVGVDKIDNQHKELFRRIGDLVDAIRSKTCKLTIGETLNFLDEYIKEHFSAEEALMREKGYPQYEAHHAMHEKFIKDFQAFMDEMRAEESSYTRSVLTNQIVVDWIVDHIHKVDKELGRYIREGH